MPSSRKCEACPTVFTPQRSDGRFCSSQCQAKAWNADKAVNTAASHPDYWNVDLRGAERKVDSKGYVRLTVGKGITDSEHRWVLAQMLGRPLQKGESAHHKNGDRGDNRPENLVRTTRALHRVIDPVLRVGADPWRAADPERARRQYSEAGAKGAAKRWGKPPT